MDTVAFRPKGTWYLLVGVVGLLVASNVYGVFATGIKSVLPLFITGVVLYMVATRHRWTKPIVRLWAVFIMGLGGLGLFVSLVAFPGSVSWAWMLIGGFPLAFGAAIYSIERWCILSPEAAELRERT